MGNKDGLEMTLESMAQQMLDPRASIADRWWALFSLRNAQGAVAREALITAMRDPSALLAHEAAYALGQMQDVEAMPALTSVLKDVNCVSSIVRHEAAEALGAIAAPEAVALLRESLESDPAPEVRETCELALRRIDEGVTTGDDHDESNDSPFFSVDPAGPAGIGLSTGDLRKVLLNEEVGMYERYGALFALRNRGGEEAVSAIVAALGARSALLKHEVAYVLGQLRDKSSADALVRTIMDKLEHPMVRHEAAEALGPIADAENIAVIEKFRSDPEPLVAQSCEVALSLLAREMQGKSFEFLHSGNVEA